MNPPPRVLILDSCAYFRLARAIHPLLAESFGPAPPYSLFVLPVLNREYLSSLRLRSKFEWVSGAEFRQDREAKTYTCKGKWRAEAERAFSYLAGYAKKNDLVLAPADLHALAVGFVRQFPVVSDDGGIRQVAEVHGIQFLGTLDLLKLMRDCGRISLEKVAEVIEYLNQENDLPMGKEALRGCYQQLFGNRCPV